MPKEREWNRLSDDETMELLRTYFRGPVEWIAEMEERGDWTKEKARWYFEWQMDTSLGFMNGKWWLDTYHPTGYVSAWRRPDWPKTGPPLLHIAVDKWLEMGWTLLFPQYQEQLSLF